MRGLSYAQAQQTMQSFESGLNYQRFINSLADFSAVIGVAGNVTQAIGNYYAVQSQQDQLKAQALSLDFAETVTEFNKNLAEQQAARITQTAQQQVGLSRMRYAEAKASARASAAARG